MRLEKIGKIELTYTDIDVEFPFKEGGQVYGTLTGSLEVGDLRGALNATNLARQRPDDQFTPALRGILKTPEGEYAYFTMDGLSILDAAAKPPRRIVTTTLTLWSVDPRLKPWNDVLLLTEMVGGKTGKSWGVHGSVYRCIPEL